MLIGPFAHDTSVAVAPSSSLTLGAYNNKKEDVDMVDSEPKAIVFTKVGYHGKGEDRECFVQILRRKIWEGKQKENDFKIWWGYNMKKDGETPNPDLFRKFLDETKKRGIDKIYIIMTIAKTGCPYIKLSDSIVCNVPSNFKDELKKMHSQWAKKYKDVNGNVKSLPDSVFIQNSKMAFVFKDFKEANFGLDLGKYKVFNLKDRTVKDHYIGNKSRKGIANQNDTVCAFDKSLPGSRETTKIHYQGIMVEPWCVSIQY